MHIKIETVTRANFFDFLILKRELLDHAASLGINLQYGAIPFNQQNIKLQRAEFRKKLQKKHSDFLIAKEGNVPVGLLFGYIESIPKEYAHTVSKVGYIDTIVVRGSHRGRGIGRELRDKFFEFLRFQGVHICQLHVKEKNLQAIKLYNSWGFEIDELRMWKNV